MQSVNRVSQPQTVVTPSSTRQPAIKPLILAVHLATLSLAGPAFAADEGASQPVSVQQREIDIPAGALDEALNRFALQTGIEIYFDASTTQGLRSGALQGHYSIDSGLNQLLADTALIAQRQPDGSYMVTAQLSEGTANLSTINITDYGANGFSRDVQGHNDVYDKDTSTSYLGKVEVERYKGTNPSDLLQGVPGVFSGEARNSGAIDLNIRGIQGPGRVPVTIDGTEQAITVSRGYNGATNRNYIDPSLIGGMTIYQGAVNERDVKSGVGGAMTVTTLQPDDIIREGEEFGVELMVEGSGNATSPRLPNLHTGEDYRTVEGYPQEWGDMANPYNDQTLVINPESKSSRDANPLNGEDYAYRFAAARKGEQFDVLAAYAYRERGNYFSGRNNADYYDNPERTEDKDYIVNLARYWKPGDEVANTSSTMESWLFKTTWHIADDEELSFNYRDSTSHYGEIMPSRISRSEEKGAIQWPESKVDAKAYNLEYRYKPQDNDWLDFHLNLWRTDTVSDTYSAGGYPNYTSFEYDGDPLLRNTALINAQHTRDGVTVSNKIALSDSLDLTLGGRFQHEDLGSDDRYNPDANDNWRMLPRAGRREEWQTNFDFAWRPTDRLRLNGGLTFSGYWARDDLIANNPGEFNSIYSKYSNVTYREEIPLSQEEIQSAIDNGLTGLQQMLDLGWITQEQFDQEAARVAETIETSRTVTSDGGTWEPDSDGNYSYAGNPCLNGQVSGEHVVSCRTEAVSEIVTAEDKKRKDHGWVPHWGVSYRFNDYSRAYLKYSETLRFPSMFESTMAFSASLTPWGVEPEHAYNWELAYVHDLTQWLPSAEYADIKLAYYHNLTRDVIERDDRFRFNNIDKQLIRGIELSGRYDNGRFFTSLGLNYNLENKVCDEDSAASASGSMNWWGNNDLVPRCFDYGFPNGYLLAQATPEFSANWELGGRFLDRRLELGGRATYYKGYENEDLEWYTDHAVLAADQHGYVYFYNIPFSWGETLILDAYARFNLNKHLDIELTGTNLTDQYYVDPATRSAMAAPGRNIKLSLTGRF
ncbi:TonB-dependent receptor [Marinobacterium mangrovicola]|uniref:Hemoglobin/transferrin/lactoferrin receptor protein n=1 Tax=Marinobacterium mangrovicola TaxID=1476959 RepID=A0A4R1GAI6_9GAMM|nr:TonB-dependent receptor [Marinobacterium mangrovicola]TCK03670.1 hemoglobin/transferrin/lactoferrin receptor protein [Marinobacterium mangrovicola]